LTRKIGILLAFFFCSHIDSIFSPSSIIALLDEETIFPRATDESLIMKLNTLSKKHPKYSEVQFKKLNFQIAHYAGDVVYDVKVNVC
jgi:myosin heavy subunit